jgi:UDP-glucuronate decarboxylase
MLVSNQTGPVNLGNPEEVSVLQLAKAVIRVTQSKCPIIFEPLPEDDPKRRQPDITLAKDKLGWRPEVRLEDGLVKTLPYFQSSLRELHSGTKPAVSNAG